MYNTNFWPLFLMEFSAELYFKYNTTKVFWIHKWFCFSSVGGYIFFSFSLLYTLVFFCLLSRSFLISCTSKNKGVSKIRLKWALKGQNETK